MALLKFQTEAHRYVYDSVTNNILSMHPDIHDVLEEDRMDLREIEQSLLNRFDDTHVYRCMHALEKTINEGDLKPNRFPDRCLSQVESKQAKVKVRDYRQQVILQTSTSCNLSCDYCIYSDSERLSNDVKVMSFDVAKRAIDDFFNHSTDTERPRIIGFYGGEPLLNFKLIQQVTNYVQKHYSDRDHMFAVTTNGTCLKPDQARYLVDNDFYILISLDGPEDIHDEHRLFKNGAGGSFRAVMDTIDQLKQLSPDFVKHHVNINAVICSPDRIFDVVSFFDDLGIRTRIGAANVYGREVENVPPMRDGVHPGYRVLRARFKEAIKNIAERGLSREIFDEYQVVIDLFGPFVRRIHTRIQTDDTSPENELKLSGLCSPGATRLFVGTDGTYYVCEKVDGFSKMRLGDVWSGVNEGDIDRLIRDFNRMIGSECSRCYLQRLCTACFYYVTDEAGYDAEKKKEFCNIARSFYQDIFVLYAEIREEYPNGLNFLVGV